jgi:lysophospholipase L1-like esterase
MVQMMSLSRRADGKEPVGRLDVCTPMDRPAHHRTSMLTQRRTMTRYSTERKNAVLQKMRAPANKTIKELAQEEAISEATLSHRLNCGYTSVVDPSQGQFFHEFKLFSSLLLAAD